MGFVTPFMAGLDMLFNFNAPAKEQGVNFDALVTFCACSTQKVPQAEKRSHTQFPIALELFTQKFLIGSINRA
jgi:hypothetical protein